MILQQFNDIRHSYIKNTNSIMMYTTLKNFKEIEKIIKENDVILEQFQLKITVIETNVDEVEEQGIQINAYSQKLGSSEQYFLNLITMPSNAVTNIFDGATNAFTASLNFLKTEGISKVITSPYVTVQSRKNVYFSSVENVPYQISTSQVNGASQSAQTNVEYKDVGLKVDLTPTILDDIVYIDLDFTIEAVIGERTSTPTTSKKNLKSSFQLKKNQLLVLSGLESTATSNTTIGIPILMEIPYLGKMFWFNIESETRKSLSIMIEVL